MIMRMLNTESPGNRKSKKNHLKKVGLSQRDRGEGVEYSQWIIMSAYNSSMVRNDFCVGDPDAFAGEMIKLINDQQYRYKLLAIF